MNTKQENEVKKQSKLLEEKMPSYLEVIKGKFVAFFNGDTVVADSHEECFDLAVKKFGSNGFALDEVSTQKPILSALVKLK